MYESMFHPNHSLMLALKRYLIYIYGRSKDYSSEEDLAKKIKYCEDILAVCDVVMPGKDTWVIKFIKRIAGLTRERGLTLYELIIANIQSRSKQPEDMMDWIKDAQSCLQYEREGTFEFSVKSKIDYMLSYL